MTDEALKHSESMFKTLFRTASDMIVIHDINGNLIDFNDQLAKTLGYNRKELLSMNVRDLTFPERKPMYRQKIKEVLRTGRAMWEGKLKGKDSSPLFVEFHVAKRSPATNEIFTIIHNVTERKIYEQTLRDMMENLESQVQKRTHELADAQIKLIEAKRLADLGTLSTIVAHELRNPLAVIKTALMNIEKKNKDKKICKNLGNISRQVEESSRIINNLLQYSKLMNPRYEEIDLVTLIRECLAGVRNRIKRPRIAVNMDYSSHASAKVLADRLQLKEVFVNLIANAFQAIIAKGKSTGKVNIVIKHDGKGKMIISIRDNGEGMTKETLGRIYEPFFTSRAKGIGLGLPLCKEIIELHKGELILSSRKGIGSKAEVILPINPH